MIFTRGFGALALASLLACFSASSTAAPIDLGQAGDYTLLATGTPWTSQGGGSLILGVQAEIHGNVGASQYQGYANGVVIHGNSDLGKSGYKSAAQDSRVGEQRSVDDNLWLNMHKELVTASKNAGALSGQKIGSITSTTTLNSNGGLSVFHLDGDLKLGKGQSLTLQGGPADRFIINIAHNLDMSAGSAILFDGVLPENVLFNFLGDSHKHSARIDGNGATTKVGGIFLGPNTHFSLGDGLDTSAGIQVLGSGIIGNLQQVYGFTPKDPHVEVSESGSLVLLATGLLGLWIVRRRIATATKIEKPSSTPITETA